MTRTQTVEDYPLKESRQRKKHWKRWEPYLSERQWGTVREDYSPYGSAWDYFPYATPMRARIVGVKMESAGSGQM